MTIIDILRQYRIGGFAIFDFTVALVGMALVAPWLSKLCRKMGFEVPKRTWIILTLPISVIAHVLVGTFTPLTKEFLDPSGHIAAKILIVGLCGLAMVGVKRVGKK